MVCDTIDAMTTARPYRDPLPISVVREELLRHRGTQFDPSIVDLVLEQDLLGEIETSLPTYVPKTVGKSGLDSGVV
jgi:HD-GYP domain-containing protein (c-di-GMP phosphodiesterase class II)